MPFVRPSIRAMHEMFGTPLTICGDLFITECVTVRVLFARTFFLDCRSIYNNMIGTMPSDVFNGLISLEFLWDSLFPLSSIPLIYLCGLCFSFLVLVDGVALTL